MMGLMGFEPNPPQPAIDPADPSMHEPPLEDTEVPAVSRLTTVESEDNGVDRIALNVDGTVLSLDLPFADEVVVSLYRAGDTMTLALHPKQLIRWLRRATETIEDECDVDEED